MYNQCFSFLLTCAIVCSFAPWVKGESTSLLKQTGFRQFSTEHGLTQNTINGFYQDQHGLMWIATEAGLNRLDGLHVEAFTGPQDIFSGDAVSKVKEDSQGALWIATFDRLYRLDKSRQILDTYTLPKFTQRAQEENFVLDIIEESAGEFWVITRLGLMKLTLNGNDIQLFRAMQTLIDDNIRLTSAINDGNYIWLATTKGLYRFNKNDLSLTRQVLEKGLNDSLITNLLIASQNQLYVSSLDGIILLSPTSSNSPQTLITHEKVDSIALLNNKLYFAVKDQLHRFDIENRRSQHIFSLSEILPRYSNYRIRNLFVDRQGKLWIGTESQGAYLWDPNSLNFETISNITANPNLRLTNNTVWAFAEDEANNLWISTDNGLNYLNIADSTITHYLTKDTPGMDADSASMLYLIRVDSTLWLATANGLIRFNTRNGEFKKLKPQRLTANETFFIYSLTSTPDGTLWLATDHGPVSFNPRTENFHFDRVFETFPESEVVTFIRYFNNLIWIGYPNRLETYDSVRKQRSTVFKFGHLEKSYNLSLTDFHLDGERLWVSFNAAGIYVLERHQSDWQVVKHFDQKHGFVDNIIHTLIPQDDYIWSSSHSGLIRISKKDFSYDIFDFYDGLPTNEFNEGAGYQTRQGKLLFGGANGLLQISPALLSSPIKTITPTVTAINVKDRKLLSNGSTWAERNVSFDEKDGFIQFELSTLDYLSPHKWHFEYWLSGDIKTEPSLVADNRIVLPHLKAGHYQFNARAVLPDSSAFQGVTTLPFTITKQSDPWWYLQLGLMMLGVLAIAGYIYYRDRLHQSLLKENQQLQRKKQNMELALLGKHQGVWEWRASQDKLAESTITIIVQQNENLVVKLKQLHLDIDTKALRNQRRQWLDFFKGKSEEISLSTRVSVFEKRLWCRIHGKVSQRDPAGNPTRATGTWTDIDEERQISEQLIYFRLALQSTRDIIFLIDSKFNITFTNQAYERLTGFSCKSLLGKNLIDLASNRFEAEVTEALHTHLLKKKSWQGEATMPTKRAPSFPVDIRIDTFTKDHRDGGFIVVMTDISSLSDRMESQMSNSYIDSITGLPNRILAQDRLAHAIAHARLHHSNVVLIYLDLDKFDFYQQTLGKSSTREILINVSKQVTATLKKDDTFARIEKDKFYLILENEDKLENITFKIEEVLRQISLPQSFGTSEFQVTACAGVACFPQDARTGDKLVQCAREALKQAQAMGHNKVNYFHRDMNKRASDRLAMKASLHHAIENNQFFLVFQPKFNLLDSQLNGFEVFVRWRTADGNIIYPSQFIKIAEETGLIELLTQWLVNQAFRTLRQWKQDGINTVFAINLIPKYCQRVGSPVYLEQKLREYNLTSMNVQIEINEKQFNDDLNRNLKFIADLNEKGFNITLDDFGIGNIPLNCLKNLMINSVKLDRNFVRKIGKDKNNDALITAIINMANALGFTPAAKSIEYQEQLDFLLNAGCKIGQGYFFSDPLSESSARQFMLNQSDKVV